MPIAGGGVRSAQRAMGSWYERFADLKIPAGSGIVTAISVACSLMSYASVMVGPCGYTHRCWYGNFYPQDLPPEWRFPFFSHRCPSVLMPAMAWAKKSDQLAVWESDAPPGFRMVLEVPAVMIEQAVWLPPPRCTLVAGYLVRPRRLDADQIKLFVRWARRAPITIDVPPRDRALTPLLIDWGLSTCGHPAQALEPTGPFAISLVGACDRRLLAQGLQGVMRAGGAQGRGLFFIRPRHALVQVAETLLLRDLFAKLKQ